MGLIRKCICYMSYPKNEHHWIVKQCTLCALQPCCKRELFGSCCWGGRLLLLLLVVYQACTWVCHSIHMLYVFVLHPLLSSSLGLPRSNLRSVILYWWRFTIWFRITTTTTYQEVMVTCLISIRYVEALYVWRDRSVVAIWLTWTTSGCDLLLLNDMMG